MMTTPSESYIMKDTEDLTQLFQQIGDSAETIKRLAEWFRKVYGNRVLDIPTPETTKAPSAEAAIWLDVSQAAARARIGNKLIYREVKAGRLKAARVGGRRELRLRPEWVDAWLDQTSQPIELKMAIKP